MTDITVLEASNLIDSTKDIIILDVRTYEEYAEGHIKNSKLIPLGRLPLNLDDLYGFEDNIILVYCRSGGRSYQASLILEDNGFNNVYNMVGGYTKWCNTFNNMK